ncbi:carbohydrate-binding protein [Clostridium paridis]|uniref:Carbohydrate-binding protein n=1 Tax=Clostridium paridis TaxID=2803863 RepID=A0A937K431_9CLOT|nr:carbohydrate-binding protein [Clostridium paridis]
MKKAKKLALLSGILSLPILLGSLPASTTWALDASAIGKTVEVQGTYSSGITHKWETLNPVTFGEDAANDKVDTTITLDPSTKYQEYQGVGISLDETSISNLWKLSASDREAVVKNLVDPVSGAGLEQFRITIGSPDCIEHIPFWSYDELPEGVKEDWNLEYFSIEKDKQYHIIDTIKLIQKYNPDAQFFASAWSAPAWMKTKNLFTGYVEPKNDGSNSFVQANKLRDDCINVFARYYVKTIQAFANEGIDIRAITLLNEPGMDVVYPAMDISIEQQQKLALDIKSEFAKANLNTELWVHDFNFWDWKDPSSTATKNYYRIFKDSNVAKGEDVLKASDAVAFHPYWGDPSVMADVAKEYPNLKVHLTETGDFSPSSAMNDFNNYSSSYTGWVGVTDQNGGTLHWTDARDNNVNWDAVNPGWKNRLVVVDTDKKTATYMDSLYGLGQFSKYLACGGRSGSDNSVKEGARRIFSTGSVNGVSNVAFQNPDGEIVMVLINSGAEKDVKVNMLGKALVEKVPADSTTTLRWKPEIPQKGENKAPVLNSITDIGMDQYSTKTFKLNGTDGDGDTLMYYGINLPDGITVDAKTGLVTLAPTKAGTFDLSFVVSDGQDKDTKTMKLIVNRKATPLLGKIEAEDYSMQNGWTDGGGNFVENSGSASGGKDVGYTSAGNWLKYFVNVPKDGVYDVEFGVANGSGSESKNCISIKNEANDVLCTVSVPDTKGWGTWTAVKSKVTLKAGDQFITFYCNKGNFNIDYMKFSIVDKSQLSAAISGAEKIDLTKYSKESGDRLKEVINNAKLIVNNSEATQEEVDKALVTLNEAMSKLVKLPDTPNNPGNPSNPSNPSNPTTPTNPGDNGNTTPDTPTAPVDNNLPKTGAIIGSGVLIAIGAIFIIAGIVVNRRKLSKKSSENN